MKSQIAKEKNIQIKIEVGKIKELNMREIDLCSIFSNLYDNAIEACENIYEMDRFIDIRSDKKNHGYGLKNVKAIVNSYDGHMKIKDEDNRFEICIMTPQG